MPLDWSSRGVTSIDAVRVSSDELHGVDEEGSFIASQLDLSNNRLRSFQPLQGGVDDETQHAFESIDALVVRRNPIASLDGIAALFPSCTSLDLSDATVDMTSCLTGSGAAHLGQLFALSQLRVVQSGLREVDLDTCVADDIQAPSHRRGSTTVSGSGGLSRRVGSGLTSSTYPALFSNVTQLDVSRNALAQLPRVSHCVHLTSLNVSGNQIRSLHDVPEALPLSLQTLDISKNFIDGGLAALAPLAFLGQSLIRLSVGDGNPGIFRQQAAAGAVAAPPSLWVPLVLWLLPLVQNVDGAEIGRNARDKARTLFRHPDGKLSEEMLELLEGDDATLVLYLREGRVDRGAASPGERQSRERGNAPPSLPPSQLPLPLQPAAAGGVGSATPRVTQPRRDERRAPQTVSTTAAPGAPHTTSNASGGRAVSGGGSRSLVGTAPVDREEADVEVVVCAIQEKLRRWDDVVGHLWRRECAVRRWAAITIQSWRRGHMARRRVDRSFRQRGGGVLQRLITLRRHCTQRSSRRLLHTDASSAHPAASGPVVAAMQSAIQQLQASQNDVINRLGSLSSPHDETNTNNRSDLEVRVMAMDRILRKMWVDLASVQDFMHGARDRAARRIQRYYRGYAARKTWRALKRDLEAFRARVFLPHVRRLQEVGRRYMLRRTIVVPLIERRRVRRLELDVTELKETVRGLQHTIQLLLRERRVASLQTASAVQQ